MARKEILDRIQKYIDPFRVAERTGFQLKDFDPGETCGLNLAKAEAADLLQRRHGVALRGAGVACTPKTDGRCCCAPAMDTARSASTIKHVMSGVNPQGCQVFSFKQPSPEDLDHDFMWRYAKSLPERGRIRDIQPVLLRGGPGFTRAPGDPQTPEASQSLVGKRIWDERLTDIGHFEDYLTRQGTIIVKFFLKSVAR